MKKKILYTTMFSILSFAAHADNTEAEKKNVITIVTRFSS